MLVKILGIVDIVAGLILVFGAQKFLPNTVFLIFGIILLLKSTLGMLKDFGSWIDFSCGIGFLLLMVISLPGFVTIILGVLILQKGLFSFL